MCTSIFFSAKFRFPFSPSEGNSISCSTSVENVKRRKQTHFFCLFVCFNLEYRSQGLQRHRTGRMRVCVEQFIGRTWFTRWQRPAGPKPQGGPAGWRPREEPVLQLRPELRRGGSLFYLGHRPIGRGPPSYETVHLPECKSQPSTLSQKHPE